jgi:hypothetical protein
MLPPLTENALVDILEMAAPPDADAREVPLGSLRHAHRRIDEYLRATPLDRRAARETASAQAAALRKVAATFRKPTPSWTDPRRVLYATLADAAEFLVEDVLTAGVLVHLDPQLRPSLEVGFREWTSRRRPKLPQSCVALRAGPPRRAWLALAQPT